MVYVSLFKQNPLIFLEICKYTVQIKVHASFEKILEILFLGFQFFSMDCAKESQFTPFKGSSAIWDSQDRQKVNRVNNFALEYLRILQFIKYPKTYSGPLMDGVF